MFALNMQGGKKGLLVNSTNLCASKHRALAQLTGQIGRTYEALPVVQVKCKKRRPLRGEAAEHRLVTQTGTTPMRDTAGLVRRP